MSCSIFIPRTTRRAAREEACAFRDHFAEFKKRGAVVLGVSTDPVKSHDKFAEKFKLPFTLLADEDKKIVEAYGVWGEKTFMWRKYHRHVPGDVSHRAGRPHQKNLAEGEAGGARGGSAGGFPPGGLSFCAVKSRVEQPVASRFNDCNNLSREI